ncbi:cytochrome c oxidase subunit II [Halobacteriales archaeon QH_7_65_31]|nr:MAG: cytochrome c oxidase subunit II [Halobacteriales archaeon QH_7_65_31]
MKRTRVAGILSAAIALLAVAVGPAAAQPSENIGIISSLNLELLYVAAIITVVVEAILIYTVVRYRNNDDPKPTQENRRLEITWTVTTAIVLLFVGVTAYAALGSPLVGGVTAAQNPNAVEPAVTHDYPGAVGPSPADQEEVLEIEVTAQKYYWTFNYTETMENGNTSTMVSMTSSAGEPLVLPSNRTVYLHVTSVDWLHAVHIPDLGLKQDAMPGKYNTITTELSPEAEGNRYQLYCAEYCGVGHSAMLGEVLVVSDDEYQQFVEDPEEFLANR